MQKLLKKNNLMLLAILVLAGFFRFYKFYQYQYFSGDEEVLTATLRHIIWDKSPSLIVQNANLGFGLGPFYHFLLAPFYYIFNFDLINLQAIASILGIMTTYFVYLGGKEVGGKKLGIIASFIYASSFLISLFDRRLVHLTLDPILAGLAFFCLAKVVKKNYHYIPFLAIPIGFSFHADASLLVLTIAIFLSWIIYKLPLKNRYTFAGFLILAIFASPLILAEFYYKGVVSGPIIQSLSRPFNSEFLSAKISFYSPIEMVTVFARVLFTIPSSFIEEHFCYCSAPPPLFASMAKILTVIALVASLIWQLKSKPGKEKKAGFILWIIFTSFIISIYIYNQVFKADFFQHYFMTFFPIYTIILAKPILALQKKLPLIFYSVLIFYLVINLNTLFKSSVKYPLIDKINLIKQTSKEIGEYNYSIKASGQYIHGGGWTELYTHYFKPAVKSYQYDFWGWIYAAYSLYPGPIQTNDPERIVYFYNQEDPINHKKKIISSFELKNIRADILDNSDQE